MKKPLSIVKIDRKLKGKIRMIEKATYLSETNLAEIALRAFVKYYDEHGKLILPLVVRRRSEVFS